MNETTLRVYSTLPILCKPGVVNCSIVFEVSTIDTLGNEDLIRIAACANNDCSGLKSVYFKIKTYLLI